jgi:thiosulfate/3-mercaptopyruvate sulfurtransferase
MAEADPSGPLPLVDVDWLRAHHADDDVLAVEVGADAAAYFQGHVPGAVALAWLDDLHERERRGVLSQRSLECLLGRKGITTDTHLVLYGEQDNVFAAYAFWLLRYYRHVKVSLLDGGRRAWVDAGGLLVQDVPERPAACYRSPGPDPHLRATRELLLERYVPAQLGSAVVDCRRPQEFTGHGVSGLDLPVLRHRLSGHVPGARNLPHSELFDATTGRFETAEVLRDRVAGLAATDDIVVYCNVGERSSLNWFVLHELLGYPHVRVYDGGWAEYGSLTEAPVAR